MTDRRRNLLILLFIAGLIAASAVIVATKPTKLGLDLKGGTSLVFQAKPTKQSKVTSESIQRTIDIMRDRVDKFGVSEPEIQRTGSDQIDVSLPGVKNADQAKNQVGKTAQLYFYDWEPNVLGPGCKPDPAQPVGHRRAVRGQRHRRAHAVRRGPSCVHVQADEHGQGDHERGLLPRRHEDQDGPRRPAGVARRSRRARSRTATTRRSPKARTPRS